MGFESVFPGHTSPNTVTVLTDSPVPRSIDLTAGIKFLAFRGQFRLGQSILLHKIQIYHLAKQKWPLQSPEQATLQTIGSQSSSAFCVQLLSLHLFFFQSLLFPVVLLKLPLSSFQFRTLAIIPYSNRSLSFFKFSHYLYKHCYRTTKGKAPVLTQYVSMRSFKSAGGSYRTFKGVDIRVEEETLNTVAVASLCPYRGLGAQGPKGLEPNIILFYSYVLTQLNLRSF